MTKIHFYLRQNKSMNETSIFMIIHLGSFKINDKEKKYLPLKYAIGESVLPSHWDKETCRAKEGKSFPQHTLLNIRLRMIENIVQNSVLELKNKYIIPTPERLRSILDVKLQKNLYGKNSGSFTLISFIEKYINDSVFIKSKGTILQYRNTLRILVNFAKEFGKSMEFEDIDLLFYFDFKRYMAMKGYTDMYFGNQIKFIRLFMNEATSQGYNTQQIYKSRKFSCPTQYPNKIYLNEIEINKIQRLKIENDLLLSVVRDLFIVGCRTGLRFSDLVRLQPSHFNEEKKILRITTQKTNDVVYIPLTTDVLEICKKYRHTLPCINNGTFNAAIKKIACMADVDDEVDIIIYKGSSKKGKIVKKYQLVCSHTARRSFATNAYLAKVPSIAIMRITGHRSEKAFLRYVNITGEDNAKELLAHPHFTRHSHFSKRSFLVNH
ncbi:MAG: site-specific integrase [Prevotellaceae bacterium]|jgi:integrase|nr:site-specific integrase [Prevotellaceae bacterium]